MTFPLVWLTASGRPALMPHTRCLQRLEVGSAAASEAVAVVERDRAREYLHGLMRRAAEPEVS